MALATNLVSYYKLDNTSDSVGSNTLTNNNSVTFVAGKIGNGANFVSASYQYFSNAPTPNTGAGAFTISTWLKTSSSPTVNPIYDFGTRNTNQNFDLYINSTGKLTGNFWTGVGIAQSSTTVNTGNWVFGTVTYDGTYTRIYVNGILEGTSTANTANIVANLHVIGNDGGTTYYNGMLDEMGIWNRALSADEVSQLFNSGRGNAYPLTDTPSLYGGVAYYKLDESSGNASDSISSNTLTNTSTTYASGKINNGAVFNGSSSKLVNASPVLPSGNSQYSIAFWVNPTALPTSTNKMSLVNYGAGSVSNDVIGVVLYNNSGTQKINNVFTNLDIEVTNTLPTSTWSHLVVTYDGSTATMYLNGTSINSTAKSSLSVSSTNLTLGTWINGTAFRFNGAIDETGIWNRALSSTEVTALYNGGLGLSYPFTTGGSNFMGFFF